jgi:tryptophan synthase alpha chain
VIAPAALDGVFVREPRRCALIPYVVAGDPDIDTTERVLDALHENGVDLIELGIPYGDPLADGATIAAAAQRALAQGTTMQDAFALAARARARGGPPVVFFTYANPVDRFGAERFAEAAAEADAAGAIVPDLPLEETAALRAAFDARGLVLPLLVAPTTPPARAARIGAASSGFVYVVSRLGVTGARRTPDFAATAARVAELRTHTVLPMCAGFGIATPGDVAQVALFADGAIVGSALIDAFAGMHGAAAAAAAGAYVASLAAALR